MRPLVAAFLVAAAAGAQAQAQVPVHSEAECAVWARELSFAQSVEAHDAAAFAAHLHPGTVFAAGTRQPLRGAATVTRAWAGVVEGKDFVLRWRPGVVQIGGEPTIALSRGPFWSEDKTATDPAARFKVGHFHSTWVKGADGTWRILFDGPDGTPRPVASLEEAKAFLAAQSSERCNPL